MIIKMLTDLKRRNKTQGELQQSVRGYEETIRAEEYNN